MACSTALNRCTLTPSASNAPRQVFPSTATARNAAGTSGSVSAASQACRTASSTSASTAIRAWRIVDRLGGRRPIPSRGRTQSGRSAAQPAIAARLRDPASTEATGTTSTVASSCRRPRRPRASGTVDSTSHTTTGTGWLARTCRANNASATGMREDTGAGTAGLRSIVDDLRHLNDLGTGRARAASTPSPACRPQTTPHPRL